MTRLPDQFRLICISLLLCIYQSTATAYKGSYAYNQTKSFNAQVNTATGTFSFTYPLIEAQGVRTPLKINLTYSFNARGMFGLPNGWQLDLDHITQHTAELGGKQWLIDALWRDETGFGSGLKYFNQHGSQFEDKGQEQPAPGSPGLSYRYVSQHKDGSRQFFSSQGLLMLQVDRFNNRVQFCYEKPVKSLESARLASIKDEYGNIYRFSYEPNALIVHYPDEREQRVYFNPEGVTEIVNPLKQSYYITYVTEHGRNLFRTFSTPQGLITELSYNAIFYMDDSGTKQMPVVTHFRQFDQASLKIHHNAFYNYAPDNNYTGYPLYTLSSRGDSLIDSNDQAYKYSVQEIRVNGEHQYQQTYEYNYLHLPVEIRTTRQGQPYLKTTYQYAISPFHYSRSTNYDKPTEVIRYVWHESVYVPVNKTTTTYDYYGNKLSEIRFVYDRPRQQWLALQITVSRYFTGNYSLLAEHTQADLLKGRTIRKSYQLSANGKTHSMVRLAWKPYQQAWQDWQQTQWTYDTKGRQRSSTRRWLAYNQPGVQSVTHRTRYQFNPATARLIVTKVSDQGRQHKTVLDTRNGQHLKTTTPNCDVTTYTYDALNRLLTSTDPQGYVTRTTYETFITSGQNATIKQSPLGNTRRTLYDASNRPIAQQDLHKGLWRTLSGMSYNTFGKVESKTNILGLTTTFAYDDQQRRINTTDPWGNVHRIEYDDANFTTTTWLNGHKHQVVSKVPWQRKRMTRQYPVINNPHDKATQLVENTLVHDAFHKTISTRLSLVDLKTQKTSETVTNDLHYDGLHNLVTSDTVTSDGMHGHKTREYDLLNALHTWRKQLVTPGYTSSHSGYRYHYDGDGLLIQEESPPTANGSRFYQTHRYDKNGQEIERTLQDGQRISYQYDKRGQLIEHAWNRNQTRYTVHRRYDADGRLVEINDSQGQAMHYRYTPNGHLLELRYPDDRSISYTLDDYDRVIAQKDANQQQRYFQYRPEDNGRLSSLSVDGSRIDFHYGKDDNGHLGQLIQRTTNGARTGRTETRFHYGAFGQMVQSTSVNRLSGTHFGVSYRYTPRGQLIQQVEQFEQQKTGQPVHKYTTEYKYDGLLRLTDELVTNEKAESVHKRYRYDGNNNLLAEMTRNTSGASQSREYSYNQQDQLVNLCVDDAIKPVIHNRNGRMMQDHKGTRYTYDDAGFLLQVQPKNQPATNYHYLPNGVLSRSSSAGSHSDYYPDNQKNVQAVANNGQWRSLLRQGRQIIGAQTEQGMEQFFRVNQSTGAVLQKENSETPLHLHRYDAYGQSLTYTNQKETNFTWNQELTDPNTRLTYLRHRFYNPELRRFLTRDNRAIDNRYAFAHANPVNNTDPTGHSAVGNYITGGLLTGLGFLGLALTLPTGGVSFLPAVITEDVGVSTLVCGASLIGSQAALDAGNQSAAKALSVTSTVFGSVGLGSTLWKLAPQVIDRVGGSIAEAIVNSTETGRALSAPAELPEGLVGATAAGSVASEVGASTSEGASASLMADNSEPFEETPAWALNATLSNEEILRLIPGFDNLDRVQAIILTARRIVMRNFASYNQVQQEWLTNLTIQLTCHPRAHLVDTVFEMLEKSKPERFFTSDELVRLTPNISSMFSTPYATGRVLKQALLRYALELRNPR